MLSEFKREDNVKERKRLHCAECKRLTIHNLEGRCVGLWNDTDNHESGGGRYSIFRCGACDAVCYETVEWSTYNMEYDEDDNPYCRESSVQYPAPVSAHFNFDTTSTPRKLDDVLDEMLYALAGSKMTLATIGLRLVIEFIVNDKNCKGVNLIHKINDLHNQNLIDDDQKDLLQRIRQRGNEGAHKAVGMNLKEIVAGMSIIEGLLEKLYNGPARHLATIEKAKKMFKSKED